QRLLHLDQRKRRPVLELRVDALHVTIAGRTIHGVAAEHGHQLYAAEAGRAGVLLAGLKDHSPDAAALGCRQNEHGPHPRRLALRIEQARVAVIRSAARVQLAAAAPAPTAD